MIVYFADRELNILGHASTELKQGLRIRDDKKTEETETGVAIFECKIEFDDETRAKAEEWAEVGNYVLRKHKDENELYTIIDSELDVKKQTLYIYAEDDGMDLLNEVVGEYEADKAYTIEHYITKYAASEGFVIGINEDKKTKLQLSWDNEQTKTERINDAAAQFGLEISFSFKVDGLKVVERYINIYQKRGKDIGITLYLGKEIDNIVVSKTISNLATALSVKGEKPEGEDDPITLKGYSYDDGDIYVEKSTGILKSRKAHERWKRYLWKDDADYQEGGYITKPFTYKTTNKETLLNKSIAELKLICNAEVNYDAEIKSLPDNVEIGDRVNIVDDKGELYLSTRFLQLEESVTDQSYKAVFGEHLIKSSGINQKVIELAAEFASSSLTAERAYKYAQAAQEKANTAQGTADEALEKAEAVQDVANQASQAATQAQESAMAASQAAENAQALVDSVEGSVAKMEDAVQNANKAAAAAQQAAANAESKVQEAQTAAKNAAVSASNAATSANTALTNSQAAQSQATEAKTAAEGAIEKAQAAETTANAAKLDAEAAQADVNALGEQLTTVSNTMTADYARKSDLTETEASLQSKISQNAAAVEITATKMLEIDETANDAQKQLQGAQQLAEQAQARADEAQEQAETAQAAADAATLSANEAQEEANIAQAAATQAQESLDTAKANLLEAQQRLEDVLADTEATEAEIAEAQAAVTSAQTIADQAQTEATNAQSTAINAQNAVKEAVTAAEKAQYDAVYAVQFADIAQQLATAANADLSNAQQVATQAAADAQAAQTTADAAKATADTAQAEADSAAQTAADAQKTADEAAANLEQAQADLTAAQTDYNNLLANAEATEEEIAEALEVVNAAQVKADEAQAAATVAQNSADTARANAEAAQTAADVARQEAEEAQTAANAAKTAANNAAAVVNGLAKRLIDAETNLMINAEELALKASKEEVTKTLGGYYTKTETDAAISVKADEINLSVDSKIEEGVNPAQNTADDALSGLAEAQAQIQLLADSIAQLVRDGNGGSLVKQDSSGFYYFDVSDIDTNISDTASSLNDLEGIVRDLSGQIDILKSTAEALKKKTEYVASYIDGNDQPCLELGEGDSKYKVFITNTRIILTDGTTNPVDITQDGIQTKKVKTDAVQQDIFIWLVDDNGHLILTEKESVE